MNETSFEARIFLEFNGFKIWYSGVFEVADYKSELITHKYKIADPIWRKKWKKLLVCDEISYSGVFRVADYEFKLKIKKFKIADLMWQTKIQNLLDWDDILYAGFLGSLTDAHNSVIHKGGSNIADEKINKLG